MIVWKKGYKAPALAVLLGLSTPPSFLSSGRLHLYVNDVDLDSDPAVAAFTEATYPGYEAAEVSAWGPTYLDSLGRGVSNAGVFDFLRTSSSGPAESIHGYYWTLPDDSDWVFAEERPDGPYLMTQAGQHFPLRLRMLFDKLTTF